MGEGREEKVISLKKVRIKKRFHGLFDLLSGLTSFFKGKKKGNQTYKNHAKNHINH